MNELTIITRQAPGIAAFDDFDEIKACLCRVPQPAGAADRWLHKALAILYISNVCIFERLPLLLLW